jgi:hypothetical protein
MNLEYLALLQVQRDLYKLPAGYERFREYLRTMTDTNTGDLRFPLVAMNPMGKDHLLPFLNELIEMDADGEAAAATAETQFSLQKEPGAFKVCLVVSDDLKGGWTNRYTTEFSHRFQEKPYYKRGWITGILWTSENYTRRPVREETLASILRAVYIQRHGYARTLSEMLAQEGYVMAKAGATTPQLQADDLAYTREVLAPYLNQTDQPTLIAALFGDPAADQLGYTRLGLSARAGLALALHDAKARERI